MLRSKPKRNNLNIYRTCSRAITWRTEQCISIFWLLRKYSHTKFYSHFSFWFWNRSCLVIEQSVPSWVTVLKIKLTQLAIFSSTFWFMPLGWRVSHLSLSLAWANGTLSGDRPVTHRGYVTLATLVLNLGNHHAASCSPSDSIL